MLARGESRTDWKRVRAVTQKDAGRLADEDEGHLPEGWVSTVETGLPKRKQGVHIRLDSDVLDWFRAHGPGYQTRINAVLRAFVRARERSEQDIPEAK
ncbi:MAG: BrnA antitoxin family protein [Beijerinckiaceae bacterium]|nr:BrnA antitoxin family protein [Beijerinckiaceae bacterium]